MIMVQITNMKHFIIANMGNYNKMLKIIWDKIKYMLKKLDIKEIKI